MRVPNKKISTILFFPPGRCEQRDVKLTGIVTTTHEGVTQWHACSMLCRDDVVCHIWVYHTAQHGTKALTCDLMEMFDGEVEEVDVVSGTRTCGTPGED